MRDVTAARVEEKEIDKHETVKEGPRSDMDRHGHRNEGKAFSSEGMGNLQEQKTNQDKSMQSRRYLY